MFSRVRTLNAGPHSVVRCEISRDGSRILAWADNIPSLWDVTARRNLGLLGAPGDVVRTGAFSPAGDRVVTLSKDAVLRVWNAETGARLAAHPSTDGPGESCSIGSGSVALEKTARKPAASAFILHLVSQAAAPMQHNHARHRRPAVVSRRHINGVAAIQPA